MESLLFPRLLLLIIFCGLQSRCITGIVDDISSITYTAQGQGKQPVVIDTDIGSFIDDSFAIAYAVQSPALDVKLIVTSTDDTLVRAKITAKLLRLIGRDDIPIGIGIKNENQTKHNLFEWAKNEDLSNYKGGVYEDGVGKMGEVLTSSEEMMDIIAIAPMINFPTLLQRYPDVVNKARIRAMAGSIYHGFHHSQVPDPEYNVKVCPWCMEQLLKSKWNVTLTTLDTCGTMMLTADEVKEMLEGQNMTALALVSSLMYFCINSVTEPCFFKVGTPILYDTVATLLTMPATAAEFIIYKDMKLSVNETGYTVVDDDQGVLTSVALYWKEQGQQT